MVNEEKKTHVCCDFKKGRTKKGPSKNWINQPTPSQSEALELEGSPFCGEVYQTPNPQKKTVWKFQPLRRLFIWTIFFWGFEKKRAISSCLLKFMVVRPLHRGKKKRHFPGDSSRDLFIPDRWRSLNH